MRFLRLAGLSLALTLGACADTPEPPPPAAAKPTPAKVVKKPAKKPAVKPAKESEPPAATPAPATPVAAEPETAAAPPVPEPPPPEPPVAVAPPEPPPAPPQLAALPPQPVDVVGKTEQEVVALLGRPARERMASAAKVMRFDADGCAVEVHFFPDVKQGSFRALEMTGGGPVSPPQCLGRVRAGRG